MKHDKAAVVYQIDSNDLLVFFNDEWNQFAENNGGSNLLNNYICNRSIWDYILDSETRHVYESLHNKVRSDNLPLSIPFRCDSPSLRRFMSMNIVPLSDGKIEYRCKTIRTEPRDPISCNFGDLKNDGPFLRMCSWCKKIDSGNNTWLEIEHAIKVLDLFAEKPMPQISHAICDICLGLLENDGE